MRSQPTTARPGESIRSYLPNFSTAYHLSWGTVTQQLVHGTQPFSLFAMAPGRGSGSGHRQAVDVANVGQTLATMA